MESIKNDQISFASILLAYAYILSYHSRHLLGRVRCGTVPTTVRYLLTGTGTYSLILIDLKQIIRDNDNLQPGGSVLPPYVCMGAVSTCLSVLKFPAAGLVVHPFVLHHRLLAGGGD